MKHIPNRFLLTAALGVAFTIGAPAAFADPSNKWDIDVSGRAKTDGQITLAITPAGGEAQEVAVDIPAATNHEAAIVLISNALSQAFGQGVYRVRADDRDTVEVEAVNGNRDFDIIMVRNTADGLTVELDRE